MQSHRSPNSIQRTHLRLYPPVIKCYIKGYIHLLQGCSSSGVALLERLDELQPRVANNDILGLRNPAEMMYACRR